MKPSQLLKTKGWTQNSFARDVNGKPTSPFAAATCFCAMGAIRYCYSELPEQQLVFEKLDAYIGSRVEYIGMESIVEWNDDPERTPEQVIHAFEAIGH